MEKAK
jgi:hypothetical protein